MDYEQRATYQFTHSKTGRKVIAQNWTQFYELQRNKEYRGGYSRLGCIDRIPGPKDYKMHSDITDKINNFWKGAEGYQKIGELSYIGISVSGWFNYIRLFLKNVRNHAAMQGDRDTYMRARAADEVFWSEGSIHYYLLPEHKE